MFNNHWRKQSVDAANEMKRLLGIKTALAKSGLLTDYLSWLPKSKCLLSTKIDFLEINLLQTRESSKGVYRTRPESLELVIEEDESLL